MPRTAAPPPAVLALRPLVGLFILFILFAGCALLPPAAPAAPAPSHPTTSQTYLVRFNYSAGGQSVPALLCSPAEATSQTPAVVLTGGDGVSLDGLKPVCLRFAQLGLVSLAHENPGPGLNAQVQAVVDATDYLDAMGPGRPVSLWGHSAGTIFSVFAAYQRPAIRSFVETSGHFQVPLCDRPGGPTPRGPCMAALSEFPAPILVVHGLNDTLVPFTYGTAFSRRLESLGRPRQNLFVPRAGHEMMDAREGVLEQEAAFIWENSLSKPNATRLR